MFKCLGDSLCGLNYAWVENSRKFRVTSSEEVVGYLAKALFGTLVFEMSIVFDMKSNGSLCLNEKKCEMWLNFVATFLREKKCEKVFKYYILSKKSCE